MVAAPTPEAVLRDLHAQWAQLGLEQSGGGHPESGGILRACAMTLVVVAADDDSETDQSRQTLGLLMHDHPSRAILIRRGNPAGQDQPAFDAHVFAECWKPFGSTQQICSEGIEILAGSGGFEEIARFLVPLRVPDLPVVVWVRGTGPRDAAGVHPVYPLADKVLFDTGTEPDADAAIRSLRRLHAYGYRVADLHWTRLTGWREVIAHLFDNGADVDQVRSAHVSYGRGPVTTCARYLEAWLRTSLPLARVSIAPEYGEPGLLSVSLNGPPGEFSVTRGADHSLNISTPSRRYRTALPPTTEATLLREELGIVGADPVYDRVLNA